MRTVQSGRHIGRFSATCRPGSSLAECAIGGSSKGRLSSISSPRVRRLFGFRTVCMEAERAVRRFEFRVSLDPANRYKLLSYLVHRGMIGLFLLHMLAGILCLIVHPMQLLAIHSFIDGGKAMKKYDEGGVGIRHTAADGMSIRPIDQARIYNNTSPRYLIVVKQRQKIHWLLYLISHIL